VFGFTLATCVWDFYASEITIRLMKKQNAAVSPQALSWRPCRAVALRRMVWSGMAWARHGKRESDMAALCKSNGKDTF